MGFADWQAFYDERAGIAEFDGKVSRLKAEGLAYECCVVEWLNDITKLLPLVNALVADNPIDPTTSLCPLERTITLGFIRSAGQHGMKARRSQAIVALRVMGIARSDDYGSSQG